MALNFNGYINLIRNVQYWKLNLIVYFRDVEFKFRNTGAGNNGASKLTVYGVTPDSVVTIPEETVQRSNLATGQLETVTIPAQTFGIESKEYVIYTELRGINLERWNVRIPYVLDGKGWNILDYSGNPDIVADGFRLEPGLGYDPSTELSNDKFYEFTSLRLFDTWGYGSTATPIYDGPFITGWSGQTNVNFTFSDESAIYPLDANARLIAKAGTLLQNYGELPCIVFYSTNTSNDLSNRKFYNVVPIGAKYYKVKLELANGESVIRFFDMGWNPVTFGQQDNTPTTNTIAVTARD
jgi:hypothetical protein